MKSTVKNHPEVTFAERMKIVITKATGKFLPRDATVIAGVYSSKLTEYIGISRYSSFPIITTALYGNVVILDVILPPKYKWSIPDCKVRHDGFSMECVEALRRVLRCVTTVGYVTSEPVVERQYKVELTLSTTTLYSEDIREALKNTFASSKDIKVYELD